MCACSLRDEITLAKQRDSGPIAARSVHKKKKKKDHTTRAIRIRDAI